MTDWRKADVLLMQKQINKAKMKGWGGEREHNLNILQTFCLRKLKKPRKLITPEQAFCLCSSLETYKEGRIQSRRPQEEVIPYTTKIAPSHQIKSSLSIKWKGVFSGFGTPLCQVLYEHMQRPGLYHKELTLERHEVKGSFSIGFDGLRLMPWSQAPANRHAPAPVLNFAQAVGPSAVTGSIPWVRLPLLRYCLWFWGLCWHRWEGGRHW